MYHVVLVNLSADARTVASETYVEKHDLPPDALSALLQNFCEIDPIENAVAETEIRVKVRGESYLLRTEHKKLILYDAQQRDLPGQILTIGQAMAELDGSAGQARAQAILQARAAAEPAAPAGPEPPAPPTPAVASKPRVIALSATAAGLLGLLLFWARPSAENGEPVGFEPLAPAELAALRARLPGVYLTGNEPGQHGIVVAGPDELKLFELGTVDAPRFVYAAYQPGRYGGKPGLATDQPGGVIEVLSDGNLVYCGETYRRIP